jgi:hypothetical protein
VNPQRRGILRRFFEFQFDLYPGRPRLAVELLWLAGDRLLLPTQRQTLLDALIRASVPFLHRQWGLLLIWLLFNSSVRWCFPIFFARFLRRLSRWEESHVADIHVCLLVSCRVFEGAHGCGLVFWLEVVLVVRRFLMFHLFAGKVKI